MYQNNGYQQNGYQGGGYQQNNYQQPAQNGNALGWDDDFEAQESSFVLLPEGDYVWRPPPHHQNPTWLLCRRPVRTSHSFAQVVDDFARTAVSESGMGR